MASRPRRVRRGVVGHAGRPRSASDAASPSPWHDRSRPAVVARPPLHGIHLRARPAPVPHASPVPLAGGNEFPDGRRCTRHPHPGARSLDARELRRIVCRARESSLPRASPSIERGSARARRGCSTSSSPTTCRRRRTSCASNGGSTWFRERWTTAAASCGSCSIVFPRRSTSSRRARRWRRRSSSTFATAGPGGPARAGWSSSPSGSLVVRGGDGQSERIAASRRARSSSFVT